MELSVAVIEKLESAIEQWADEVLPGRPAILGTAVYLSVKKMLEEKTKEIEEKFPL